MYKIRQACKQFQSDYRVLAVPKHVSRILSLVRDLHMPADDLTAKHNRHTIAVALSHAISSLRR